MKRVSLLFILVVMIAAVEAKEKKEPVIMTVMGKEVPLSEFIFMAKKDNSVDLKDKQSVRNYVELYKNYKLKVADAEALTMHEAPRFSEELEDYRIQLQQSYLYDKFGLDSAIQVIYERTKVIPGIKQIYFMYPQELFKTKQILTKDTLVLYEKINEVAMRIKNGESFEEVGKSFKNDSTVVYSETEYVSSFQFPKALEEEIFSMEPGAVSRPIRSLYGFHLIQLSQIIPNPGKIRVAHILTGFPTKTPTEEEIEDARMKSEEVYQKAMANEDFDELIQSYSTDSIGAKRGGFIEFGLGDIIEPMEKAGFGLEKIGDISKPFQTSHGFHILKLVERKGITPLEEVASNILDGMKNSEHFFDLYHAFDERMKSRHGFIFYKDAYEELQRLADVYHPLDTAFHARGLELKKTLVFIDTLDFSQDIFVEYMINKHRTAEMYSNDFMLEVYRYFEREIITEIEKRSLERDYPDFQLQMKEYYDGILLFEVSNKRIWSRPVDEQEQLEAEWIKELNEKYPVIINWKAIKKIKKI